MTPSHAFRLIGLLSTLALAGCIGSASDTPSQTDQGLLDSAATGTVSTAAASLDSGARNTEVLVGSIDNDAGIFSLGGWSGTISDDTETVTLNDGGQIVLTFGEMEFAALFEATPTNGNRSIGVIGLPTDTSELPGTGSITYAGTAQVRIQDDTTGYELTGQATINADFDTGRVSTRITELDGNETESLNAPNDVADVADINFVDSRINGATFSGGTPTLDSSIVSDLSGTETSDLDGGFYGPDADEAGAVFSIDDSANGTVIVFGTFIAE